MLGVWRQAIVVNSPRCAFSCLAIVANMSIARNLTGIDLPVGDNHGRENSHQLFTSKMCVNDNEQRGLKGCLDFWLCVRAYSKELPCFCLLRNFFFLRKSLVMFFFSKKMSLLKSTFSTLTRWRSCNHTNALCSVRSLPACGSSSLRPQRRFRSTPRCGFLRVNLPCTVLICRVVVCALPKTCVFNCKFEANLQMNLLESP